MNLNQPTPGQEAGHCLRRFKSIVRFALALSFVLTLGSPPSSTSAAEPESAQPTGVNYGRPFEPPTRPAFIPLPPGAVEPMGWLRDWCLAARDGYTGHMDDLDEAFKQAWSTNYNPTGEQLRFWDKGAWPCEGGGYWFDGLVKLGYAMHDDFLLTQAKARLDVVVNHMSESSVLFVWWLNRNNPGDMSEKEAGYSDWFPQWASGFLGRALAAYYAGSQDKRVLRALEMAYDGDPAWLRKRFAQTSIYPAFEAYTWSGNSKIKTALTDLFEKRVNKNIPGKPPEIGMPFSIVMPNEKSPWYEQAGHYLCNDGGWITINRVHGVHFNELVAPWALGYLWTGKREFLDAVCRYYDLAERDGMQPYGVFVADECCGPTGAFRGTETCDVSAYLWSQLELLRIAGQGVFGDRVERAFFNAAPAVVSRDFTLHVYDQTPNRMWAFGRGFDYRKTHWPLCCTASLNRFLPNYVTHMWMATYDNGLAATYYGPCKVTALAGDQLPVELTCQTDYPFNESIEITVKPARQAAFPLLFRIPGWCPNPHLSINGSTLETAPSANGFVRVERRWSPNDNIRLEFPMSPRVVTGRDTNAGDAPYASVYYGPLLFALPIPDTKDPNTVDPNAKYNFALAVTGKNLGTDIIVERGPMPGKWSWPLASPLKLAARAVSFNWKPTRDQPLPSEPVAQGEAPEKIMLVPYGCTKFRVSMFPITDRVFEQSGL